MKKFLAMMMLTLAAACSPMGQCHQQQSKCHCTQCECSAECCKDCGEVCKCNHHGDKHPADGAQCHKKM